jgi:hypothetical protein
VIVLEQSAQTLAPDNLPGGVADQLFVLNELVFEPLMVALGMKMGHEAEALGTDNGSVY